MGRGGCEQMSTSGDVPKKKNDDPSQKRHTKKMRWLRWRGINRECEDSKFRSHHHGPPIVISTHHIAGLFDVLLRDAGLTGTVLAHPTTPFLTPFVSAWTDSTVSPGERFPRGNRGIGPRDFFHRSYGRARGVNGDMDFETFMHARFGSVLLGAVDRERAVVRRREVLDASTTLSSSEEEPQKFLYPFGEETSAEERFWRVVLDLYRQKPGSPQFWWYKQFLARNAELADWIVLEKPRWVVLAARWQMYGDAELPNEFFEGGLDREFVREAFRSTLKFLRRAGVKTLIVADVPELASGLQPHCGAVGLEPQKFLYQLLKPQDCFRQRSEVLDGGPLAGAQQQGAQKDSRAVLWDEIAAANQNIKNETERISLLDGHLDIICRDLSIVPPLKSSSNNTKNMERGEDTRCFTHWNETVPFYASHHHLSSSGSRALGTLLLSRVGNPFKERKES